ncbi:MAG TPA: hypothetical protein VG738_24965 [Chitinophagaceae bacterium]|nr:hypothetical protein [Chitinophagaceae bacterium]
MKRLALATAASFLINVVLSQSPKITWGDEFKMHKGSTDLSVIATDNTGVYLQESHAVLKNYFVIGVTTRESATLIKLNNNFTEVYKNDFNKELRGKEFEEFFSVADKLYILASDYSRRDKTLTLYAAVIDNKTGELAGDFQQLASWTKDEKNDDIHFKLSNNVDKTSLILVSSIEGKENNTYQVQEFDKNLKPIGAPINISNEFDPKTFQLEDVLFTTSKKVVLVARIYEYAEGKRKRDKFLDFLHYNIRIYDNRGKQQFDIKTDISGKWLVSTKVVQEPDKDLVIAAFYSNQKRGKDIDGLLVERIDPNTGNIITVSQKEINTSLISPLEEDSNAVAGNDDESKQERKERERLDKIKDESEGFTRDMRFRNIFYTPDNSLVMLAEKYHRYTYTTTSYTPGVNGSPGYTTTQTYTVFETGDLMMFKIAPSGDIDWLQVLPKAQKEVVGGSYGGYGGGFTLGFYYFNTFNLPFYSGFGALQNNNTINIIFNDNPKNEGVLQLGQHVRTVTAFRHSSCFNVALDAITGKYTRRFFFSNSDVPTAMPRLGSYIGDDMFIVGKEDRIFGKTKIAVAKISVDK